MGAVPDPTERASALRQVPLFRLLSWPTLCELGRRTDHRVVGQGEVLIRQGDPGDFLGVLLSGTADVDCDGHRIGSLSPGEHFGEMALIDGEERSATITATSEVVLLLVSAADFDALLKIPEVSRALLRSMSARLRDMQRRPQI